MALNDVYMVRDRQLFLGQICLNVYFYQMTASGSGSSPASLLGSSFELNVVAARSALQSSALSNTSVEVINLADPTDYSLDSIVTPATGGIGGDGAPPFVAASFRNARSNAGQRHAYKRFAGIPESHLSGNTVIPAALGLYNTLAGELDDVLAIGTGETFTPVLVRRPNPGVGWYGQNPVVLRTLTSTWTFRGIVSQASRSQTSPP